MRLNSNRTVSLNTPYRQGRWNKELIQSALTQSQASGKTKDWINYADICHSIQGLSLPEWRMVANHYFTSPSRSPTLFLKLANLLLSPGLRDNLTQEERQDCLEILENSHKPSLATGLFESLFSHYLGTQLTHYPCLLTTAETAWHRPVLFTINSHRNRATRLQTLSTPFHALISQTLDANTTCCDTKTTPKIAVVGNSPEILRQASGEEIDAADIVIRFNHVSQHEQNHEHTGKRTDLWVMSPSTPVNQCPGDAKGVIVTGLNALHRPSFYWRTLPDLDKPLSEIPANIWYDLVSCFGAPPSAGTLILASLQAIPASLDIHCYGFTTDKKSVTELPNHHADTTPRSTRHNWLAETGWLAENNFA